MIFSGFGHRPNEIGGYSNDIFVKLVAFAVETIPQFKPTKIISGMSLGWEQALAMAAIELEIPLVAAIPFSGQEFMWPEKTQYFYHRLLDHANKVNIVSSGGYQPWKLEECDKWVVDNSEAVFALWNETTIYSAPDGILPNHAFNKNFQKFINRAIEYAREKDRHIHNLWPLWEMWDGEVQFEIFRDSMLDMSCFEG